jgi:hypothetical protein
MDLVTVQDAILTTASNTLAGLGQCEAYAGQFGVDGPTRGRVKAPAFFVSALAMPPAAEQPGDGRLALDVRWAAYCLARNARGPAERGRDAMGMAGTWALHLNGLPDWGLAPHVMQPRLEDVRNLYSAALDDKGFALWAVTWSQVVLLGESIWNPDGTTPTEIWLGFSPEVFPDDYEQQDTTSG